MDQNILATPSGRRSRVQINRAIAHHMAQQAGMVSYAQLIDAGLSAKGVRNRIKAGELFPRSQVARRPGRSPEAVRSRQRRAFKTQGAYASHEGPLTMNALRWAALQSAPPDSVIGHLSACAMLDLQRQRGTRVHVLHHGHSWRGPRGVLPHKTNWLPEQDRTAVNDLPCTTVSRSLLTAARDVSADHLDDLLDRAVEIGVYDAWDLRRVLAEHENARGRGRLVAAVGRLDDKSGEFRSTFERRTTRLVQRSTRIPAPVVNVLVEGFRPDLWFFGTRAIVECDGRDYHRSPEQVLADERREEILRALGFEFLRLRWSHVKYEEERTLARIERFVLANLAPPVPR